jgi:phosphatidylserine decarboxylase
MEDNNELFINLYKTRAGEIVYKPVKSSALIDFLYGTKLGKNLLKILTSNGISEAERLFLSTRASSLLIDPFVKKNHISLKDCIPYKYDSFNEFFIREIYTKSRILCQGNLEVASPSDGRVSIFKIGSNSKFRIKKLTYSVSSLLQNDKLAKYYEDGYLVIVRLCVDDYHHYSYSVSGEKTKDKFISGRLNTVNPIAYNYSRILTENARSYSVITLDNGMKVTQMEVGAMGVGRIVNDEPESTYVIKGNEKGHFEFGGSTIVLLFPKDSFVPAEDLVNNTKNHFETKVLMGESLGVLNSKKIGE